MYSKLTITGDLLLQPSDSVFNGHTPTEICTQKITTPNISHMLRLSWAAGLFDGDGCVLISKQQLPGRKNLSYRLCLCLVQNCYGTVDRFRGILALPHCLIELRRRKQHNRQIYDLRYVGQHAVKALQLMQPYLFRKSMEAEAALDFWSEGRMGVMPGVKGLPLEVWETRARYFKKLKKLK